MSSGTADDSKRRPPLGRGLSALFGEYSSSDLMASARPTQARSTLPIEVLHPGRFQPRRNFDEEAIAGLIESVRERGVLQPLLVRRDQRDPNRYEIIAGERRWRAAQQVGLHEVPVVVHDFTDREALEIALIENIQRQDLNILEEAEGYRRLLDEFQHTQENLARVIGKSRSHIANTLRLLGLPDAVRQMVESGELTAGHARALLTAPEPQALARLVVERALNVRQTEQLVRNAIAANETKTSATSATDTNTKDADLLALERDLTNHTGLKVTITPQSKGGVLNLHYRSLDQLDGVLQRLRSA